MTAIKHGAWRRAPSLLLGALALLSIYLEASASPSAKVVGVVTDRESGQPIGGAVVSAAALGMSALSDDSGEFRLSGIPMSSTALPTTLSIQASGYGEWTIQNVRLVAGDTLILDAELGQDPTLILVPPPRAENPVWPAFDPSEALGGALAQSQLELPLPASIRVRVTGFPHCDLSREYTVEVVDFKEYAKHVLPNEWVNSWPWESLRAGAMAVKMYAWSYIAQGGKWPDADVYDSTCDQVYNPAVSYESTNKTVDSTWNWRLTRGSQLLRTYYRAWYSQCEDVGLQGNCMGQYESRDMAYDLYTWDEILMEFYDDAVLSPVWDPPGGFSLRFYGNGYGDIDRVKVRIDPHVPADVGDADFTLEWWMKAVPGENDTPACSPGGINWVYGNQMFDRDIFGDGDYGDYGVSLAGGRIAFGVSVGAEGNTICGSTDLRDSTWHHVAVTRSFAGQMQIYVDGLLDGQGSGPAGDVSYRDGRSTSYPKDPYLVIGAEKHDINNAVYPSYSGWLDEIRLSNVVRYSSNFARPADPFVTDASTAALYHFDEGVGNVIGDSSGATGGPSPGLRTYGGVINGPKWSDDTHWYVPPPTPTPTFTASPTATGTASPSATHSSTPVPPTATATPTPEPPTPTLTPTPSAVPPSPTATHSPTAAPPSPTASYTPTDTPTATPSPTVEPSQTPTSMPSGTATLTPMPADLNGDGQVNVLDIQLCVNVFLGTETDPQVAARADANGDGVVNVLDVQLIANIFLSG